MSAKLCLGLSVLLAAWSGPVWAEMDSPLALWAQANAAPPPSALSLPTPSGPQPAAAAGLALFPGVLVHGTGHFYAGRPLTGSVLAASEAAAVYLIIRGGMEAYSSGKDIADMLNNSAGQGVSQNLGDTGNLSYGLGLAAAGLVVFLGSWLFDVTGAPLAAMQKQKAAAPAGSQAQPVVSARLDGQGVAVVLEGF